MGLSVSGSRKSLGAYAGLFIGSLGWMVKAKSFNIWAAALSLANGTEDGRRSGVVLAIEDSL